jgi:hypothetical protein
MTYLDIVNKVLRRLRESETTSVQGTGDINAYTRLIGDYVNEAKAQIETSYDWSALRDTLTLTTAANTFNYVLVGAENSFKTLDVFNDTSKLEMRYQTSNWFNTHFLPDAPAKGAPTYYNYNGVDANGDSQVDIFPIPDQVYTIRFNVTKRNPDLSADTDKVVIPVRPIILLAVAMAIEERGEDGGQQSINAYQMAQSAMSDEIAMDAARHPEDSIWYPV